MNAAWIAPAGRALTHLSQAGLAAKGKGRVALGPYGDESHGDARELRHPRQIATRVLGEIGGAPRPARGREPALVPLVRRRGLGEPARVRVEAVRLPVRRAIADADSDLVEAVQH